MQKSIIEKIKDLFSEEKKEEMTYMDVKTQDGKILRITEMLIGGLVTEITEDGEISIEGEVEFLTEDGVTLKIKNGVIEDIKESVVEELAVEEEVKMANVMRTDGVAIFYEGTELIPGETKLFLDEAMTELAPDGEHLLEGGIKIVLADGVLISMEEVSETDNFQNEMYNILNTIKDELNQLKQQNQKLSERFNKFAAEPSEQPTKTKVDFSTLNKKQMREEKIKFFSHRK